MTAVGLCDASPAHDGDTVPKADMTAGRAKTLVRRARV
jgi:hypothetical protein